MTTDEVIRSAVYRVIEEHEQADPVANSILNWYEQVLEGNESISDGTAANRDMAFRHITRIYEQMVSPHEEEEDR